MHTRAASEPASIAAPDAGARTIRSSRLAGPTRYVRYEWLRLTSLRSTWLIAAAALLLTGVISSLLAYSAAHGQSENTRQSWAIVMSQGAALGAPLAVGFVGALYGILGWTEDASTQMAATTLTTFQRRLPVAAARFASITISAATLAALACLVSLVAGVIFFSPGSASAHSSEIAVKVIRVIAYSVALALIAGATCVLLRSPMLAAFALLLVPWLLEPIIGELFLIVPFLQPHLDLVRFLPFQAMNDMLTNNTFTGGFEIGPPRLHLATATTETTVFTAALVLTSTAVFCRRDPLTSN